MFAYDRLNDGAGSFLAGAPCACTLHAYFADGSLVSEDVVKVLVEVLVGEPIVGKHGLFMVYTSTYNTNAGANVFNIYMDTLQPSSVDTIAQDKADNNVKVFTAAGEIIVVADVPTAVEVYSLNGQRVAAANVDGEASIDVARGFYLLRAVNANGVNSYKVIVK